VYCDIKVAMHAQVQVMALQVSYSVEACLCAEIQSKDAQVLEVALELVSSNSGTEYIGVGPLT